MAVKEKTEVVRMEDLIKKPAEKENESINKSEVINDKIILKTKTIKPDIPRGIPKSGRIWKNEKTRFSSIIKTKGIRNSFKKKQELRVELKRTKEASRAILAAREEEKQKKKERRRENLKIQEENRKKSEIVQVIKNTTKIKKFKKKHLRSIEKRDTTNM